MDRRRGRQSYEGRAADQKGRNRASAHKTLIQPTLRGGDFCRESLGGWEKSRSRLDQMATQRECVHVCRVPHALCDARHSRVRAHVRCFAIHATLCALPSNTVLSFSDSRILNLYNPSKKSSSWIFVIDIRIPSHFESNF